MWKMQAVVTAKGWIKSVGLLGWCGVAVLLFIPLTLTSWARVCAFVVLDSGPVPDCSFVGTSLALRRTLVQRTAEQRILAKSRVLPRENGFMRIETPLGTFWEPYNSKGSEVLAQLAEIEGKYSSFARPPARPGDVVLDC